MRTNPPRAARPLCTPPLYYRAPFDSVAGRFISSFNQLLVSFDTSTQRHRNGLLFRVSTSHGVLVQTVVRLKPVNKVDRHHIRQEVGSAFSTRPGWQGSRCIRRGQARRHGRATHPQHTRTRPVASGARHQGSPRRRSDGPPTHVARPAAALDSGRSCAGTPSR